MVRVIKLNWRNGGSTEIEYDNFTVGDLHLIVRINNEKKETGSTNWIYDLDMISNFEVKIMEEKDGQVQKQ